MNSDPKKPTFDEVAEFVRGWARISVKKQIAPHTLFERDLGITGDDGDELLQAIQRRFKVDLTDGENGYRTIFGLAPNEYLFNSEAAPWGFGGNGLITLFSPYPDNGYDVRAFTVGELHVAIQRARSSL